MSTSAEPRASLLALTPAQLTERTVEFGGRAFHAKIARAAVLERGIVDYAAMTSLPATLRERLSAEAHSMATMMAATSTTMSSTSRK